MAVGAQTGASFASFSNVLADNASEAELKRTAIRFGAATHERALELKAKNFESQGTAALVSGAFNMASAAAGGYGNTQKIGFSNAKGGGGVSLDDGY